MSFSSGNDGTSARTRAFSFDEVMLRRKNKKVIGHVKEASELLNQSRNKHYDPMSHARNADKESQKRDESHSKQKKDDHSCDNSYKNKYLKDLREKSEKESKKRKNEDRYQSRKHDLGNVGEGKEKRSREVRSSSSSPKGMVSINGSSGDHRRRHEANYSPRKRKTKKDPSQTVLVSTQESLQVYIENLPSSVSEVTIYEPGFQTVAISVQTSVAEEKALASKESINVLVQDSPHRIFISGISKFISSQMLMEIARVFGALKAYSFEVNAHLNQPCAYLEYIDQSVTLKACAGLNGMKLGGQVLTVVKVGNTPIIPEHVKPLLEKPSRVLKLKNVVLYCNCVVILSR